MLNFPLMMTANRVTLKTNLHGTPFPCLQNVKTNQCQDEQECYDPGEHAKATYRYRYALGSGG
jgi:hypothetical protein